MAEREYHSAVFDRYAPEATLGLRAAVHGVLVFAVTIGVSITRGGAHWWVLPLAILMGGAAAAGTWWLDRGGRPWPAIFAKEEAAPPVEEYAYEQSLVTAGRVDEALASYEAIITAHPGAVAPRMKAADLYAERQEYQRATELLREAQRSSAISSSEDVRVASRLADLYAGPLHERGRALIELRRVIDRQGGTPAVEHARRALRDLKARSTEH